MQISSKVLYYVIVNKLPWHQEDEAVAPAAAAARVTKRKPRENILHQANLLVFPSLEASTSMFEIKVVSWPASVVQISSWRHQVWRIICRQI